MSDEPFPFSIGTVVLGGGALLLSGLLLLGFVLPTDWEAEASAVVEGTPEAVFAYLDSPEGWRAWTTWPDSGTVREGPERGVGAALIWDDEELGAGSFRLVEVEPTRRVAYSVDVGGGAMRAAGSVTLTSETGGVRVDWREAGNLGRNPLMGYWARFMRRAQTRELEKGLVRLGALTGDDSTAGTAVDTVGTGGR
jgi:uncharacterized protein YndB with AHSA1/START domain